jgi:cytochrome c oxidase subunit 3
MLKTNINKKQLIFSIKKNNIHKHPYHLVNNSPWPFIISFGLLFFTSSIVMYLHNYMNSFFLFFISILLILLTIYTWFRDVTRESVYEGQHTKQVQKGLKNGMLLFIFSELMLFFAFFWAFFHSALTPTPEIGSLWPPIGIELINNWYIPLLNTIILLTSGATITWSHYSIIYNNNKNTILSLILTILLAFFFLLIQSLEYFESTFTISDSIYGTTFFLLTGFHGFHVIIGVLFILTNLIRLINQHFTKKQHLGFEASIWYWHFVDVIWLFLFIILYWWGGN